MPSKSGLFALLIVAGVAVAILFTVLPGRYQLAASADRKFIWRMNTANGELSLCVFPLGLESPPTCGPWGGGPLDVRLTTH
jgi:hypothetical protein